MEKDRIIKYAHTLYTLQIYFQLGYLWNMFSVNI